LTFVLENPFIKAYSHDKYFCKVSRKSSINYRHNIIASRETVVADGRTDGRQKT